MPPPAPLTSTEIPLCPPSDPLHFHAMRQKPKVAIIGVTGFIGRGLPALFADDGISVTGVSRSGQQTRPLIQTWQNPAALDPADHLAVINLSGESIDRRWTGSNRRLFRESRVGVTRRLVETISRLPRERRPKVLVNASAVGIYGDCGDVELLDNAAPGAGYLADLCREWEDTAAEAEALGLRVVRLRVGIVLGRDGAAFRKLSGVFRAGIGGRLGSGRQWMPWIHVDDLRAAIHHCVMTGSLSGPVNGCAPTPETNRDFTRKFARAVRRPALLPVPGFALKLALGGFGGALLQGQRALPSALLESGFRFAYPTLDMALADLVRR
jgi:uncharacterized protein